MNRLLPSLVVTVLLVPAAVRAADDDKTSQTPKVQIFTPPVTRPSMLPPLYVSLAALQAYDGYATLRGVTQPARLTGTITGPATNPYGNERLGIDLETEIDRTAFGVSWNAELPNGGPVAGNEVKLTAELELVKEA